VLAGAFALFSALQTVVFALLMKVVAIWQLQRSQVDGAAAETTVPATTPPASLCGKDICQESSAVLERGCLERLTEAAGEPIARRQEA
jgi:hypothetical protein